MINERLIFERYKIDPIRLDLLYNWLYDFIILQLRFFLDTNSNKHISV